MRISDWSSDVCSSDLLRPLIPPSKTRASRPESRRGRSPDLRSRRGGICGAGGGTDPGSGRCQTRRDRGRAGVLPHEKYVLLVAAVARGLFAHLRAQGVARSEEHTSELRSLMRISYAVFCLKKQNT